MRRVTEVRIRKKERKKHVFSVVLVNENEIGESRAEKSWDRMV